MTSQSHDADIKFKRVDGEAKTHRITGTQYFKESKYLYSRTVRDFLYIAYLQHQTVLTTPVTVSHTLFPIAAIVAISTKNANI